MVEGLFALAIVALLLWGAYRVLRAIVRDIAGLFRRKPSEREQVGSRQALERREPTLGGGSAKVGRRVPDPSRRRTTSPSECWLPLGRTYEVHGLTLHGGLLYVGSGLREGQGHGTEPALIDPSLRVNLSRADASAGDMPYWPRYADISPAARAGYLQWIAGGRKSPDVGIGHVFLYFYGLERRLLVDQDALPETQAEAVVIVRDVRRLLRLYGGNHSFRRYATGFLNLLGVQHAQNPDLLKALVGIEVGYEIPTWLKVAIALKALKGSPVPGALAYLWLTHHPETRLRTPATRCAVEFKRLFLRRYAETFGEGMLLKPNRTTIGVSYTPASPGIPGSITERHPRLPDVTMLKGPIGRLQTIAEACTDDLGPYSRAIGKAESTVEVDLATLALLPEALLAEQDGPALEAVRRWLDAQLPEGSAEPVLCRVDELLHLWPTRAEHRFAKGEQIAAANLLQALGVGMEPDPRFGGKTLRQGDQVALFRLAEAAVREPTDAFRAATLLLQLASAVAGADGSVSPSEQQALEAHLEQSLHLDAAERQRLHAHLMWQLGTPASFAGLAKRIQPLDESQRRILGEFLIGVAAADGIIDAGEVRTLEKIYGQLGLERKALYSTIHHYGATPASEPVTVRTGSRLRTGAAIPPPPAATPETTGARMEPKPEPRPATGFTLDPEVIRAKLEDTRAVHSILSSVFDADDETPTAVAPPAVTDVALVAGLDEAHSALFHRVSGRGEVPHAEFEAACTDLGLMAAGAMETLNDAAFELIGEPLLEEDEDILVSMDVAEAMVGQAGAVA